MKPPAIQRTSTTVSWLSIFTSTSTLICCALPALLVGLGAGATLISLTGAFPQLIWLSEHKVGLFIVAGLMLGIAGVFQWRSRFLPCPADQALAQACIRQRKMSEATYFISCAIYLIGGFFAFVAPLIL